MKKSIAIKWAKALESGEYQQRKGVLRKGNSFCCLGVLCNLHAQEFPEIAEKEKNTDRYLGNFGELPEQVVYWCKMRSAEGDFYNMELNRQQSLTIMNDDDGLTFTEIAKVIRKNYKEL